MLILLLLISIFQALLGCFGLVVGSIIIHDMYVVNTVCTLYPEVSDEEIPLWISLVLQMIPFELVLPLMHSATCVDFGVVTHVRGSEVLACKVGDPITEIFVTRRGEASLLVFKGASDVKCYTTFIAMVW